MSSRPIGPHPTAAAVTAKASCPRICAVHRHPEVVPSRAALRPLRCRPDHRLGEQVSDRDGLADRALALPHAARACHRARASREVQVRDDRGDGVRFPAGPAQDPDSWTMARIDARPRSRSPPRPIWTIYSCDPLAPGSAAPARTPMASAPYVPDRRTFSVPPRLLQFDAAQINRPRRERLAWLTSRGEARPAASGPYEPRSCAHPLNPPGR